MAATGVPVAITKNWALVAATGYQWLVDLHGSSARVAFASSTPSNTVVGHRIKSGDVLCPPTGMSIYCKSDDQGGSTITLTQGNAL